MILQNAIKGEVLVQSGEFFKINGCYEYHSHVEDHEDENCYVPSQAYSMLFDNGEKAPKLGSCIHNVFWKLTYSD